MGTPAYMSPEQARGDELDERSDQYSLGVILFQLFTGRLPFDGDTAMQTAMMHLNEPVPSPRRLNPDISSAVERVILTALAKDPEARFPSVKALNTAFQAALRGDELEWLRPTVAVDAEAARLLRSQPAEEGASEAAGSRRMLWLALSGLVLLVVITLIALPPLREAFGIGIAQQPAAAPTQPLVTEEGPQPPPTEPPATRTPMPTISPPIASDQCPDLRVFGFNHEGNTVSWQLDNGTEQTLVLEDMLEFGAPAENQSVEFIQLGTDVIFMGPATSGEFSWEDGGDRRLPPGEVKELAIQFAWEAEPTGYQMNLIFNRGCQLEGTW